MATIADEIREWQRREVLSRSEITRSTEAYNAISEAIASLLQSSWVATPIKMIPDNDADPSSGGE